MIVLFMTLHRRCIHAAPFKKQVTAGTVIRERYPAAQSSLETQPVQIHLVTSQNQNTHYKASTYFHWLPPGQPRTNT